jgi:DNA-binding winged helix-turn-helix (wHTH) protein/tetratricopeptide (TPR) repeat protein/TolB-like protein
LGDEKLPFDLSGLAVPSRLPLAHVPRFALGPLSVEPPLRQITAGNGQSEMLEPLVLQALIALSTARGHTLSRDDLVAACWDGRIVSDDAINRVISKLRRVLTDLAGEGIRLETVPKVGYRRVVQGDEAVERHTLHVPPATPGKPDAARPRRTAALAGALALAATAVAGSALAYWGRTPERADLTIGVEPVASTSANREVRAFAGALTGDLAQLAGPISRVSFVDRAAQGDPPEDFIIRIAVDREQNRLVARARLVDSADDAALWSDRFVSSVRTPDRLRRQVAMATAGVMRCGLERSAEALGDPASIRLFFAACNAGIQGDVARAQSFARLIVTRRPDVAAGWACLAITTLYAGMTPDTTPQRLTAARADAIRYARRALRLDPHVGRAYEALALAAPQGSAEQFAILANGIAADPELASLYRVQSYALFNAGYVRASVAPAERALALDPTSPVEFGNVQRRLEAVGRISETRAMQVKAEDQWPNDPWVLKSRIFQLRYEPDPVRALADMKRLEARLAPGDGVPPLLRAELRWRADPAARDLEAIEREAAKEYAADPISAWATAATLTRLGETERALRWVARAPAGENFYQWSLLFWPDTAAIRRDPRFFAAMARIGLVDVWRARDRWPDFCSEPGLAYDCREEAARLARGAKRVS